ncbi:AAA family ATPase [Stenotrophomonas sp. YAU14A_MKIMI4_1]|uniref:AAA family ATPase n=1 Tax=Stenotrophomonas sp. YAU14A_MKIMI4_1 TaxID=2072408 RepID=UPI00131ED772|nr:AAA family ATPase [Stenotrophomonas sp. YAU14A_MKIMI4_1]
MKKLKRFGASKPAPLLARNMQAQLVDLAAYYRLDVEERQKRRPPFDRKVVNHPEVANRIAENQGNSCAYCELPLPSDIAVTHYRPTSNAVTSEGVRPDIQYYGWFAYEWKNLIVLCTDCRLAKGEGFPLEGSPVGPDSDWNQAVRREKTLLLDPYVDSPSDHLKFTRDGEAVGRSRKGQATIALVNLNRPELVRERAKVLSQLQAAFLASMHDGLARALASFTGSFHFRGVVEIFLQNLLRVAHQSPVKTERLRTQALFARLQRVFSPMADDEALELFSRMNRRDIGFLIHNPYLKAIDYPRPARNAYLSQMTVGEYRSIRGVSLLANSGDENAPCIMLLGENASGKTSILQAIKIALSTKEERARLRYPRGRWMSTSNAIDIQVELLNGESRKVFSDQRGGLSVDADVDCQVLAYGARRYFTAKSPGKHGAYFNATLFNPQSTLRDPRDWLEEQDEHTFNAVARALRSILDLGDDDSILRSEQRKITVKVRGNSVPLEHLSDGYRSLFAMTIDIMRELLGRWDNLEVAEAIVLIDEIEVHLHPRWKMRVMSALRNAMPRVQFICTTHDPLCLRGMKRGEVLVIERDDDGRAHLHSDLPDVSKLRIEQILSSDHFGLSSTDDPEQDYAVRRLAEIAGVPEEEMTLSRKRERDELLKEYEGIPFIGSSQDRQILAEALTRHLRNNAGLSISDRAEARADSIDAVMAVLKRAMRQ